MSTQKLKILALHGHAMSGELLKAKIGAIRQDTKKLAEWYCPDAPISIPAADAFFAAKNNDNATDSSVEANSGEKQQETQGANASSPSGSSPTTTTPATTTTATAPSPVYSWYDFSKVNHALSEGLDLFAPTSISQVKEPLYTGMPEAMAYLGNYCKEHGPFDVIFSFSQGTILAALIVCQLNLERQRSQQDQQEQNLSEEVQTLAKRLPKDPTLLSQPFKAAVFCSGLPAKDPYFTQILQHEGFASSSATLAQTTTGGAESSPSSIRSLHIWGLTDDIISPEWSRKLMSCPVFCGVTPGGASADDTKAGVVAASEPSLMPTRVAPLVEYATHEGGHVVASQLRKPIKAFLQSLIPEEDKKGSSQGRGKGKAPKAKQGTGGTKKEGNRGAEKGEAVSSAPPTETK